MPKLGRTTPCAECPWLRKSIRGYLGASDAEEFYRESITREAEMPCHMQIDYGDPAWKETQLPEVDFCAGGLIYFQNNMKMPRRASVLAAYHKVKQSAHVFSWPIEFITHHMPRSKPEEICKVAQAAQWPFTYDDR